MSEQFKQIQTKAIEFISSTSSKTIEAYKKNPRRTGVIVGIPLVGFGATFGIMTLTHTEKDTPAITCEVSKKWQETRKNSERRFGVREISAGEINFEESKKNSTPGNTNKDFTAVPKSSANDRSVDQSEKVIGTITPKELGSIIGEKLNLNPTTKNHIPALTAIFNKILSEIDKEKLLYNEEQMDLYSWFMKQYPTLVVVDGKINPNNLTSFVNNFNIEAERLRKVGFEKLAKKNCVHDKKLTIVNTGNAKTDNENNLVTVSKLLDLEQADRSNNPVNKGLFQTERDLVKQLTQIEGTIAQEREAAKKLNKLNEYNNSKEYLDKKAQLDALNKGFKLNLPKTRKPNISESEEIARKVLIASNLLEPNNTLSESRLVRLYDKLNSYYKYDDKNSKLKDPSEFKNDLNLLTTEIVAIDNELRDAKATDETFARIGAGAIAAGIGTLGTLGFFALRDRRRQNQANGEIQKTDEWQRVEDARLAAEEKARRNALIVIDINGEGEEITIPNKNLEPNPEEGTADDLRSIVNAWEEINPNATDDIVADYIEQNAERLGVITLRTYDELARELDSVVKQINSKSSSNSKVQLKAEIQKITWYLDLLNDFIHNGIIVNLLSGNTKAKTFVQEQIAFQQVYIPKLMSILKGFADDIEDLQNPVNLTVIEAKYLAEIELLSKSIPRYSNIEKAIPRKLYVLSESELIDLELLFLHKYKKDDPNSYTIFKIWVKSQYEDFNLYNIAMYDYLKGRRKLTQADVVASKDKSDVVEIKRQKLEKDLELFIQKYRGEEFSDEQMLAYYQFLNPESILVKRREEIASDTMGVQPLFARLFDDSIIQDIIKRYDIQQKEETLQGLDFSGLLGGITSVTRLLNRKNEQDITDTRFTIKISKLFAELKCIALDLNNVDTGLPPEVLEYKSQVILPVLKLLSDLNNYTIENAGLLEELVEIYDQIKKVKSKDERQMFIDDYNQRLLELTSDSNFIEFNDKLHILINKDELLNDDDQNNITLSKKLAFILKSSKATLEKISEIFKPIEETLE